MNQQLNTAAFEKVDDLLTLKNVLKKRSNTFENNNNNSNK